MPLISAEHEPHLLEPRSQRGRGLHGAHPGRGSNGAKHTLGCRARFRAEQVDAFGEQVGNGASRGIGFGGVLLFGERDQVGEREAAPGSTQHSEPGDSILRIEQRAGECEYIEDLRPVVKAFELDSSEGNASLAKGLCDGRERFSCAGENGNAEFAVLSYFASGSDLCEAGAIAGDELDDLFDLGFVCLKARVGGELIGGLPSGAAGHEAEVQREDRRGGLSRLTFGLRAREGDCAV